MATARRPDPLNLISASPLASACAPENGRHAAKALALVDQFVGG